MSRKRERERGGTNKKPPPYTFKISRIPKGNHRWRRLYCPDQEGLALLRQLLPDLQAIYDKLDRTKSNHGCVVGRSPVSNAFEHIGRRFTLHLDITDFFESVTEGLLTEHIPQELLEVCLIDGAPQQGLPTSPLVANIAFLPADHQIERYLKQLNLDVIYTRYVDDLNFSFDTPGLEGKIITVVKSVLSRYGFELNNHKTRLQDERNGRRLVTGVAVDRHGLHPTRKVRRKLRAAIHQENETSARGLQEWCRCKLPNLG